MDNIHYNHATISTTPLHRIGAGFCGSVWSDVHAIAHSVAIKREDGGRGRSLKNDSDVHQQLLAAYKPKNFLGFTIPKWHGYIAQDEANEIVHRFPRGYSACNLLLTERIHPVPETIRHHLVKRFFPRKLAHDINADPNNHDCLIRPYLGKRRRLYSKSVLSSYSLRNFPLHLDQIEELGLDAFVYSHCMAQALAFMHWSAKIDANDVEFVLAPANDPELAVPSKALGDHCMWILDFDCCRSMTMDSQGLKQAARAFLRNDPFYPRPGKEKMEDIRLWDWFKSSYLRASSQIIGKHDARRLSLPSQLMELIEQMTLNKEHPGWILNPKTVNGENTESQGTFESGMMGSGHELEDDLLNEELYLELYLLE
ncbi:zinc finger protein-domain-containing protein [Nemania sp. FL0916]|nr:zinc finger protein-domain-containing protein [Nemania sp. FL0916]